MSPYIPGTSTIYVTRLAYVMVCSAVHLLLTLVPCYLWTAQKLPSAFRPVSRHINTTYNFFHVIHILLLSLNLQTENLLLYKICILAPKYAKVCLHAVTKPMS